jgi:hypothetical protein
LLARAVVVRFASNKIKERRTAAYSIVVSQGYVCRIANHSAHDEECESRSSKRATRNISTLNFDLVRMRVAIWCDNWGGSLHC